MFSYRSSVLYNRRKFSITLFLFFFFSWIDRVISKVIYSGNMRGTKYIISRNTSFTVAISTERVNCIQLRGSYLSHWMSTYTTERQRQLPLLKTFRHSIYALIIVVHYRFINLVLNLVVCRYSKLTAIILVSGLLMKLLLYVTSQLAAAAILWRHNSGADHRAFSFQLLTPW